MARNRFAHSHNGPRHQNSGGGSVAAPIKPAAANTRSTAIARPNDGHLTNGGAQRIEAKPAPVTPEAIAQAAYFLWLERGGNEVMNWLEAERRLASSNR